MNENEHKFFPWMKLKLFQLILTIYFDLWIFDRIFSICDWSILWFFEREINDLANYESIW